MRKSNVALSACVLSYVLTGLAYMPTFGLDFHSQVRSDRPDYRQVFEKFLPEHGSDTETAKKPEAKVEKATSLIVVSDPSWCKPCRKLDPVLDKLSKEGYDIVVETPAQYRKRPAQGRQRVTSLPTLIFRNAANKVVTVAVGFKDENFIKNHLDKPGTGVALED